MVGKNGGGYKKWRGTGVGGGYRESKEIKRERGRN
jgi:hypothetical protein